MNSRCRFLGGPRLTLSVRFVWRSWVDGCPNGESAEEMTARVDRLIQKIVKVTQAHHEKEEEDNCAGDVIVVCHGRKSPPPSPQRPPPACPNSSPSPHLATQDHPQPFEERSLTPLPLPVPLCRHVAVPDRAVVRAAPDGRPPVRGRPGSDHSPRIHPPHLRRARNARYEPVWRSGAVKNWGREPSRLAVDVNSKCIYSARVA